MKLLYLLFPTLVSAFKYLPTHLYSKKINNIDNVKIIEPINIENKKDTPALIFFSGLSGNIPNEIYNNFLNYISSSGISCYLFNDDIYKSKSLVDYIYENYANVTISGHSSGASKAIKLYSECNNINNLILFDPVDDRIFENNKIKYLYNNFFDKLKNEINLNDIKNYLLVKAENSYKWGMFPPKIPFIPVFDINEKVMNINDETYIINNIEEESINENNEIVKITKTISKKVNSNKRCIEIKNFGHTDLLDEYWSNTMRKIIKDSNEDKSFEDINEYHKFNAFLINQVCYNQLNDLKKNIKNIEKIRNIKFNINNI